MLCRWESRCWYVQIYAQHESEIALLKRGCGLPGTYHGSEPDGNVDNHLLGSPPWERYSLTSSELSAINTTVHKSNNDTISDTAYIQASRFYYYADLIAANQTKHSTSNALLLISGAAGTNYTLDGFYHVGVIPVNDTFTPPQGNTTSLGARVYDGGLVAGYENSYLANRLDYWLKSR